MASGQTINDRILAAKHSIAGQGLAKAVCKATTEELIAPKRKHLDYLLRCTEEPNVSIPHLANLLLERVQNPNWIVVFKSLVTIHHMMCYGNERFTQYLASSNTNFQLSNFMDKGGVQGYDMSPFVRRYAKYLSEKSVSYMKVAFDFCKVKRGKDGGTIRKMNSEKLLKTLPILHEQLDALLDFEATTQDLNNGVINGAFMLLFRDLIRLFACYNDGIINLLEKYFDMNKKHAREALDIYKRFLIRMDRVGEFLKTAEKFGIDKQDIPDLARAPSSLLEALESHLANLEGRKPGSTTSPAAGAQGNRVNVESAVNILSSTSTSFGASSASNIDGKLQRQLLAEEEQAMQKCKDGAKATNPFASDAPAAPAPADNSTTPNILDLFGMQDAPAAASEPAKSSDDLLQLSGNPFASVLNSAAAPAPAAAAAPAVAPAAAASGGFNFGAGFPDTANANAVGASFFGDMLQPQGTSQGGVNGTGGLGGAQDAGAKGKLVSGDLDASLANLTTNLNLASGANKPMRAFDSRPKGPPMASVAAQRQQQATSSLFS